MEKEFWLRKWQARELGFHTPTAHPLLTRYFSTLALERQTRVLVPLCGKSLDMHWLLHQGCSVVGVELSEIAIEELFQELEIIPSITQDGAHRRYSGPSITIFVGDLFELTRKQTGGVDWVYDRAALIALPEPMRTDYSQKLMQLSATAPQFIIALQYDQSLQSGPPFSITGEMIEALYKPSYEITRLAEEPVEGGLKGICPAEETVWHLTPLSSEARDR